MRLRWIPELAAESRPRSSHRGRFVRRPVAVAALSVLCLLLVGCGRNDAKERTAAAEPSLGLFDGVEVSGAYSSFAVQGEGFAALVDGGSPDLPGRRPAIRVLREGETVPTTTEMPSRYRRAMVYAWWTGTDVAVLSTPCARWTTTLRPPVDEATPKWLQAACGSAAVDLWRWNPAKNEWREIRAGLFVAPSGFNIYAPLGSKLVVRVFEEQDGINDTDQIDEKMLRLDASTGGVEEVPSSEDVAKASDVTPCQLGDGTLVAAIDPNEVPAPVKAGQQKMPNVYAVAFDEGEWRRLDFSTTAYMVGGCSADHRLVLVERDDIVILSDAKAEPSRVRLPPGDSVRIEEYGIGGIVAMVDEADSPAGSNLMRWLLLDGREWREIAVVDRNDGSFPYVVGERYFRIPAPKSATDRLRVKVP